MDGGVESKKKQKRPWTAGRVIRLGLILVFLGVFIYSATNLIRYYYEANKSQRGVDELKSMMAESTPRPSPTPRPTAAVDPDATPEVTPEPVYEVLSRFSTLFDANSDLVGWIKIDGTNIDYPVMKKDTEKDGEFYLRNNFRGEYDINGLPFMDYRCEIGPNSEHLIVYGHNMKSQIMFHYLTSYEEEEFFKEHQYILFDTIYEEGTYQVIAAFVFDVAGSNKDGFQFHRYVNFKDEEQFEEYIEGVYSSSLYDTGVKAEYGDEILTLATCEYTTWNSRFVVVCKKVS